MAGPPRIFDRRLHALRLARAARGPGGVDFLRNRVAEDLAERLEAIQRRFDLVLEVSAPAGAFERVLAASPAAAKVGRLIEAAQSDVDAGPAGFLADEGSLDLIVSNLALHWVDDLVGALIQIRRSLKPDGLFLGALLGGATLTELRQSLTSAEVALRGGAGPRVSPFVDAADGAALLQRAGLALPVVDTDRVQVIYDNPLKLIADLRAMGETSALIDRPPLPLTRSILAHALEIYQDQFAAPDGRIIATFEIITLTGWAPHPDQPKALKPGSAQMSLADALTRRGPQDQK